MYKSIIPKCQSHLCRHFKCFPITEHVILLTKFSSEYLIMSINAELIILGQITQRINYFPNRKLNTCEDRSSYYGTFVYRHNVQRALVHLGGFFKRIQGLLVIKRLLNTTISQISNFGQDKPKFTFFSVFAT